MILHFYDIEVLTTLQYIPRFFHKELGDDALLCSIEFSNLKSLCQLM